MASMEWSESKSASVTPWLSTDPMEHIAGLPDFGFRLPFDHVFTEKCWPFMRPHLHQIPQFLGFAYRYAKSWLEHRYYKKSMFIDNISLCPWLPIYGAPIGGIGCGTIGRGYRGEFCRFQMIPGMYTYEVVEADQFIVCIRRNGSTVYQRVLSPHKAKSQNLSAWSWEFPAKDATYHALYPCSWTVYDIPEFKVLLICKQISPIFPNDYKDTSLPCAIFHWTIKNYGTDDLDVSIVFTFKNGQGDASDAEGNAWSETFSTPASSDDSIQQMASDDGSIQQMASGVLIHQVIKHMNCTYAVAANQRMGIDVSCCESFDPKGTGKEIWEDLKTNGRLKLGPSRRGVTGPWGELACAVCASVNVPGRDERHLEFCLAWDMPTIKFGGQENEYHRRYTRFFGRNGDASANIVSYAFSNYRTWVEKIEEWQNPILSCTSLPSWYKSALFNELYFVSDGGTVWVEGSSLANDDDGVPVPEVIKEYGRFAYLEGHEYRMYNTYDVHHYASFALVKLWPKLQLSLQHDIAMAIPKLQAKKVMFYMNGEVDVSKAADCVPHDIGNPADEPWVRLNAYVIHPTHEWKDLNVKFVLQVYRDFALLQDRQYLSDMYPHVKNLMCKSLRWDTDGDGIIDNAGFADQTFDAWTMSGASAYCGGMWLAAVKMFCEMARLMEDSDSQEFFSKILNKGSRSFEEKVWNSTGGYYNYDSSSSAHHDSIMADQLAGQWFLKASNVDSDDIFPKHHVISALRTIFKSNVLPFCNGTMGAINGMRPNGDTDTTSPQSDEFWVGVNYALAATMIQENVTNCSIAIVFLKIYQASPNATYHVHAGQMGLMSEAWQTAYGAYHTCYERYGLGFQTPEAYFENHRYRSLGYMRPLCVWSMQLALESYQAELLRT